MTKTAPIERDWKAVRRGKIYCAPCCGFNCTWEAFQKANREARKLATSLGKGWSPRVWENRGWCFAARSPCRHISVHKHGQGDYTAYLSSGTNCMGGQWVGRGKTAKGSVRSVIALAENDLREIRGMLAEVEAISIHDKLN